jgi:hypothetical protein
VFPETVARQIVRQPDLPADPEEAPTNSHYRTISMRDFVPNQADIDRLFSRD